MVTRGRRSGGREVSRFGGPVRRRLGGGGFTLIELMIVMSLIVILASIGLYAIVAFAVTNKPRSH